MTKLEAGLVQITSFLHDRGIPYMVIGGFANLFWGVERFTRDLDLTIEVSDAALEKLVTSLSGQFELVEHDALAFARRNHLIQLQDRSGVPVDLIVAALPYESMAIRRAVETEVAGTTVRICSPEDLIIHKLASDRPQDAIDVEGVVLRQAVKLDREYLGARIRELAVGLDRPAIVDFYHQVLRKADSL